LSQVIESTFLIEHGVDNELDYMSFQVVEYLKSWCEQNSTEQNVEIRDVLNLVRFGEMYDVLDVEYWRLIR